jgi:hypothetical protein
MASQKIVLFMRRVTKTILLNLQKFYEHFLNDYQIPKNALILHDGGKAFKRQKTSIFDTLGFKNHVAYPTDVHQFLSSNDNNLHG